MPPYVTAGLVLLASLSPLLTFAYLWQLKEWRVDRLMDHLRSEGALRQLLGVTRLPVVALALVGSIVELVSLTIAAWTGLGVLSALSVIQIVSRRQRLPVWTQKAIVLLGAAMALDLLLAIGLLLWNTPNAFTLLLLLPLVQPAVLALCWVCFYPLDWTLKQRILRHAAELREKHGEITVIGITGSVGKTTTKELLACVLGPQATATPAYVNSEIGVARWLIEKLKENPKVEGRRSKPEHIRISDFDLRIFIVEMGAYRKGEIALLCSIARPEIGVVTFIGTQHIALFGSQKNLLDAKAELVEALPEKGHTFLNVDSAMTAALKKRAACAVTTVSTGGTSDLEAYDIEETANGIRFRTGDLEYSVPVHGTQNVCNVLLTIAVADHLGIDRATVQRRLQSFAPLQGTFSVEQRNGVTILDDTHNCSPESATAAIAWAESQPAKEKVLLTSGIIEQGEATQRVHRDLGSRAAPVFERVIFLNKKLANSFAEGYSKNVEIFSRATAPVAPGTLLVCLSRMPRSVIDRLLPGSQ